MIDRRRCLVVILACVGVIVLLLALGCATAPKAATARMSALDDGGLTLGGTGTVGREVGPEINGCDPRCAYRGVSMVLPDLEKVACYQRAAVRFIAAEVRSGRILGPYPPDVAASYMGAPPIRWSACPLWVEAYITDTPYVGCAAGVAWGPSISVSLGEPERILRLSAHETSNSNLTWQLWRHDLGDTAIVSASAEYAASVCQ